MSTNKFYTEAVCGVFVGEENRSEGTNNYLSAIGFYNESEREYAPNEGSLIRISAVYRAVNLISGDIAVIPVDVYKKGHAVASGRDRANEHPISFLLNRKPNSWQTPYLFFKTLLTQVLVRGNAFAFIHRDERGNPIEILPIPASTYPMFIQGETWYCIDLGETVEPAKRFIVKSNEDVIHIRGLSFDGMMGISVIDAGTRSFRKIANRDRFSEKFFENGAVVSGVLEHPNKLSVEARNNLKKSMQQRHQGIDNAFRMMLLEEGAKYHQISMTPEQIDLVQQEQNDLITIANWFNLTPDQLGYPNTTSYNSVEVMSKRYLMSTLNPWLTNVEQELTIKLLSDKDLDEGFFAEFDRNSAVRMDAKTQAESIQTYVNCGVMCPNEGRELIGMPPRNDGLGDRYILPKNMGFADEPHPETEQNNTEPPKENEDEPNDDEA